MRGWVVFLWALAATVILIALGIFGTLIASGKVVLFPTPVPSATPTPVVTPVIDTKYSVLVLNATPESGLATQFASKITGAGWPADKVSASAAGSTNFAHTTVYYALPSDQAAALGLAQVVGGAAIAQSTAYQATDNPTTAVNENQARQLTVVIGIDSTAAGAATATPTP